MSAKLKMAQEYPESCIDIVVFSSTEQSEESTKAWVDDSLPASLISKSLVDRLGVRYAEHQYDAVADQPQKTHSPLGHVELHLHRSDVPKSQPETFWVVDTIASVVLRRAAVPRKKESNVLTLGLEPQTEGTILL